MTYDELDQMYATYRDNCPDTPALSFEDWYNDYYLADDEDKKPVKMPYDKHDAVLVAKAFQNSHIKEQ